MKRSDLAHQIKEMIVDVLSEVTVVDKMTTPEKFLSQKMKKKLLL
jgi:hypothetical protein